ncbi:MAG: hypothetical protein GQ565_07150 [Candidatus Aegiribacteria sp.]|nr:hypothetical protein [Candidatus Aegiribacteria sp.]
MKMNNRISEVWDAHGRLVPISSLSIPNRTADVAAIVVSRNRPDLTDQIYEQLKNMGKHLSMDIFIVEMGSDEDKRSKYTTIYYADEDYRGKCYGHNVGLRQAMLKGEYRYYWFMMNDVVYEEGADAVGELVRIADKYPDLGLLSPAEPIGGANKDGKPIENSEFHYIFSPDYLSVLIRGEIIEKIGFFNPEFKYCWGAIIEYAYKLYKANYKVAYIDKVCMKHLGSTTYGVVKNTISKEEYRKHAKKFATLYFREHYGSEWDSLFREAATPQIECGQMKRTRKYWEEVFSISKPETTDKLDNLFARLKNLLKRKYEQNKDTVLKEEIKKLNPWYYSVTIKNVMVTPGIGSKQTPEALESRVLYRSPLLVGEVVKLFDFKGKSLLDLGSNCAYWSARFAEHGAQKLLAVEGRIDYIKQGNLYWDNNDFMEKDSYEFIQGNVMDSATWDLIESKGPFDFTLCCGILYHIPDYKYVLEKIAEVTTGGILVDTRVSEGEAMVSEPGGYCFDAIIETRNKKNPNLRKLIRILEGLEFTIHQLKIDMFTPIGLKGADDYNESRRVALLALKTDKSSMRL